MNINNRNRKKKIHMWLICFLLNCIKSPESYEKIYRFVQEEAMKEIKRNQAKHGKGGG